VSTVLWANLWIDGTVECESEDRHALYAHARKLDALTKELVLPSFLALCDTTDVRFNLDEFELPEGATSTSEVMAAQGVWLPHADAVRMLEGLLSHITARGVRFGWLSNAHADVVEELRGVIAFAKAAEGRAQKFNFCIVT
jgi:hypothetical protein